MTYREALAQLDGDNQDSARVYMARATHYRKAGQPINEVVCYMNSIKKILKEDDSVIYHSYPYLAEAAYRSGIFLQKLGQNQVEMPPLSDSDIEFIREKYNSLEYQDDDYVFGIFSEVIADFFNQLCIAINPKIYHNIAAKDGHFLALEELKKDLSEEGVDHEEEAFRDTVASSKILENQFNFATKSRLDERYSHAYYWCQKYISKDPTENKTREQLERIILVSSNHLSQEKINQLDELVAKEKHSERADAQLMEEQESAKIRSLIDEGTSKSAEDASLLLIKRLERKIAKPNTKVQKPDIGMLADIDIGSIR